MKQKPYKARSLKGAERYVRMLIKQRRVTNGLLEKYAMERRALAKLAATGPCFNNPLHIYEAQAIRDEILMRECRLNPDGTEWKSARL